ncbi:DUF1853 family protein [Emcibacter nanhaiensis]
MPSLISRPLPEWLEDRRPLADTDLPPDLAPSRALGPYFENLFAAVLARDEKISGVRRNIQVTDEGITKGEFDFLFYRDGQAHHVETTVKFYLGTGSCQRAQDWIGPGRRDRLDLKLAKMMDRQLQLSGTQAGRKTLQALGYETPDVHAFTRGCLFHPLENWVHGEFITPDDVNPAHLKGWWTGEKNMEDILRQEAFWLELSKPFWLDVRTSLQQENIHSPEEMTARVSDRLAHGDRPVLLAALRNQNGGWREVHRGFIVPDNWSHLLSDL